jgi:hypothetical protein
VGIPGSLDLSARCARATFGTLNLIRLLALLSPPTTCCSSKIFTNLVDRAFEGFLLPGVVQAGTQSSGAFVSARMMARGTMSGVSGATPTLFAGRWTSIA